MITRCGQRSRHRAMRTSWAAHDAVKAAAREQYGERRGERASSIGEGPDRRESLFTGQLITEHKFAGADRGSVAGGRCKGGGGLP